MPFFYTQNELIGFLGVAITGGGGGGGTWGSITGTLSSQTDLQNALNAKQNLNSKLTQISDLIPPPSSITTPIGIYPSGEINVFIQVDATKSVNPTPINDFTEGYIPGSLWVNKAENTLWYCESPGAGTSIWKNLTALASDTQNGLISSYIYNFLIWQPASVIASDQTIANDGTVSQGGNLSTNFGYPNSYVLDTINFKVSTRLNYVDNMILFLPNIPSTVIGGINNFSNFYSKNEIQVTNHSSSNKVATIFTLGTKNNAGIENVDILGQGNAIITNSGGGLSLSPSETIIARWSDSRQRWEIQ